MIRKILLRNFKCFESETISIGKLTLLAGLNGMGKSSVIQSLLLMRQGTRNCSGKRQCINGAEGITTW